MLTDIELKSVKNIEFVNFPANSARLTNKKQIHFKPVKKNGLDGRKKIKFLLKDKNLEYCEF